MKMKHPPCRALVVALLAAALPIGDLIAADSALPLSEIQRRMSFLAAPVTVQGRVQNRAGQAVAAKLTLDGQVVSTDLAGAFSFTHIKRKAHLLQLQASGYREEVLAVNFADARPNAIIQLPAIIADPRPNGEVRMLFGGDVSFGRRFLDSSDSTPRGVMPADDPKALILVSDPLPGSTRVLQFIKPIFQAVDWSSVNLETPVTSHPATPHPTKDYAFFSLPESLPALLGLGVDYAALGNNHVYDYLQGGLMDTLDHLDSLKMPHSGAGTDETAAFAPARLTLKNTPYSFLSMTSVTGNEHPVNYVATAQKGGAADLTNFDKVKATITEERALGRIPIVQLHGGVEYSLEPSEFQKNAFKTVSEAGAALVVAHHPHTAQGVGWNNGVLNIHSLGNLAFDQDRLETMLGLTARVDMQKNQVRQARLLPHYLEDYRPRPVTGAMAAFLIKRIASFSGNYGGFIFPYLNQGWVALQASDALVKQRAVNLTVQIPAKGYAVVDLRHVQTSEESLALLSSPNFTPSTRIQVGRDLMEHHGDMEDYDVDDINFEAERWDTSKFSSFMCVDRGWAGSNGLCSTRSGQEQSDSVVAFRNRIRVIADANDVPNKDLTLYGYLKRENAGQVNIIARYYASEGDKQFGEENALAQAAGTGGWLVVESSLHMPADQSVFIEDNARAVRFFLRHSPPANGNGLAVYDNLALVAWEKAMIPTQALTTPHINEFVKIIAPPGQYRIKATFKRYVPGL
jgi:poly-gamma-glutamate capsule biosynthesis protein CapA/YwtB (metallophosphatase superfamily)